MEWSSLREFSTIFQLCHEGEIQSWDRTKIQGGQGENIEQTKGGKIVQKKADQG